jgi:serine/threonine protein kinase
MKPVLDGYEFYECIGAGTFGKVYRAKNIRTQEVCAIKIISLKNVTSRTLICVDREISILRSLSHENIIRLLDVVSSPKAKFLILEYCNGGDLYSYLKSHERLTESFVQSIVQQIIKGMNQLHKLSYIHRDIKLANIFLSFNGGEDKGVRVKLGDLGLAREMNLGDALVNSDSSLDMSIVGTPLSMAPEIIKYLPYSFTADIWSLGLLTYELLFNKECFYG